MNCLLFLSLVTLQAPQAPSRPITQSLRPAIATLEGPAGASSMGLFDQRTGEFVPERLPSEWNSWSGMTPVGLDFSGRSQITSGLGTSPRLRSDVGAGGRIELPHGQGTVLQMRGVMDGTPRYAIVHVNRSGIPRIVTYFPALSGGASPFLPKVGIDPEGAGLLIATHVEAGGDLLDADLSASTLDLRTASLPPLDFGVDGIWLGDTWGFGVASSGPYRFPRLPLAQAEPVRVPVSPPASWRGDAAANSACSGAVAVAGTGPDAWLPYVFGPTGPALAAADTAAQLSPAGFAPESTFGPFLALCDDGVTAAWRVEQGAAPNDFRDIYLGRRGLAPTAALASGDHQIIDTVNEVGRIIPSPFGGVLFAVGEPNNPTEGGLEGAEVLRAQLGPTGSLTLDNVSRTSSDTTLPLFNNQQLPTWTPALFVLLKPTVALVHDDEEKTLVILDLVQSTRAVVLDAVREVYWVEAAGTDGSDGSWVAAIERDDDQRRQQIIGAASAFAPVVVLDPGTPSVVYRAPTAWRQGAGAVAYLRRDAGLEFLDVVQLGTLVRSRWSQTPGTFTPPIVFTSRRTLAFTRRASAAGNEQRIWAFRGPVFDMPFNAPPRPTILFR